MSEEENFNYQTYVIYADDPVTSSSSSHYRTEQMFKNHPIFIVVTATEEEIYEANDMLADYTIFNIDLYSDKENIEGAIEHYDDMEFYNLTDLNSTQLSSTDDILELLEDFYKNIFPAEYSIEKDMKNVYSYEFE